MYSRYFPRRLSTFYRYLVWLPELESGEPVPYVAYFSLN